ncbi:MAG: response regulator [Chitinispirillales bacterium]|jgi:CheY-like chemotaxis protein|nr:response regulator [Chitinispirillales bacterium]
MRLTKEQLLSIGGLNSADMIDQMQIDQFDEYCDALAAFAKSFAQKEERITKAFINGDNDIVTMILSGLGQVLENICADDLFMECNTIKENIKSAGRESVEVALFSFLSTTSELSENIQIKLSKNGSAKEAQKQQSEAGEIPGVETMQKIILAVDDIPVQLNMIKLALSDTKYKFSGVTSADAALNYISKFKPSLFILDIEMPKMNGYELAEKIRESGNWAPIIFLTGNATKDYVLKAKQVGASEFLVKPINVKLLLEKVNQYIR